jgi:hypothetical protein
MQAQERIRFRTASRLTLLALALLPVSLLSVTLPPISGIASAQSSPAPSALKRQSSIPLLSPDQMKADDRATAQSQQQAIAQSAQFYGYALDTSYAYREIACPVAPKHLLLAYEATSPNGSLSRFTAVVRRSSEGEIAGRQTPAQIIPILHFGVVPFIPAIANPHSIEVFNTTVPTTPSATEVLTTAQTGSEPLLVRSLCYLAMVGEEPAALETPSSSQATIHAPVPTVVFQERGKIRQLISIRSSASTYQVWALTFLSGSRLLSATRQEHPIDRTPLVLNAINAGSPAGSTTTKTVNAAPAQVFAEPATSTASAPASSMPLHPATTASTASAAIPVETAPTMVPPAPRSASPVPSAAPAPVSTATEAIKPLSPPATPPTPDVRAIEPTAATVVSPVASTMKPAAPASPATPAASEPVLSPRTPALTPTPAADTEAPQPTTPLAVSSAGATPPAPAATITTPMTIKPSPPPPPGRLIPSPPPPPSRFIPDSALKTPPHLLQ